VWVCGWMAPQAAPTHTGGRGAAQRAAQRPLQGATAARPAPTFVLACSGCWLGGGTFLG
jgi:hypothetical protein